MATNADQLPPNLGLLAAQVDQSSLDKSQQPPMQINFSKLRVVICYGRSTQPWQKPAATNADQLPPNYR